MVYLAELLAVMTDGLKIIRICARNVPRTRTQALIDDDAFLASLSPRKAQRCRVLDEPGRRPVETQKKSFTDNLCLALASKQKKVAATVCPLHFDTKSEQSDCNKSSVRKKFRTSAFNN